MLTAEIARRHLPAAQLHGAVTSRGGATVGEPVVVIERKGKPYAWVLGHNGHYQVTLPAGDYTLYATARGYSRSAETPVQLAAGAAETRDFTSLEPPGRIDFSVTDARNGRPLDARIVISEGDKPLVEFLGRRTFFTELEPQGQVGVPIAPGDYLFTVTAGGGFLAAPREVHIRVPPAGTARARVAIDAAVRSARARLVLGGPAPSRRPGGSGHPAGVPGALAARRRPRFPLRQRP